jgi:hypothetical protein
MIQVLIQDIVRQHVDRIEPACVADLFALSEAKLPAALAADVTQWAAKAAREIHDLPSGDGRATFVAEVAALAPDQVPAALRAAVLGLPPQVTGHARSKPAPLAVMRGPATPNALLLCQGHSL